MSRLPLILLTALVAALSAPGAAHSTTVTYNQPKQFVNIDGVYFDVTVGAAPISVESLTVQLNKFGSSPPTSNISVYTRSGTAFGFETSSAGWTLRDTLAVSILGPDIQSTVDVSDFTLAAGQTHGFYVYDDINVSAFGGMSIRSSSTGGFQQVQVSNADATWTFGTGSQNGLFGAISTVSLYLSGSMTYTVVPEPSTAPLAGLGLLALGGYAARRRVGRRSKRA